MALKKRWKNMLISIAFIYVLGGFIFYFFQDKIFFKAVSIPQNQPFLFTQPFEETFIQYNDEYKFSIVKFSPTSNIKHKLVLYFHGNNTNINHYAKHSANFTDLGYSVWMCDYPTFGKSTGKFTEEILYAEAEAFYKLALKEYEEKDIIIYGKSLGTGFASYLASRVNCQQLILETPYYSLTTLAQQWGFMYPCEKILNYKIPSYRYIQNTACPISIFHGTNDGIIYLKNALKLKPLLKKGDNFIIIEGGKHNNLADYEVYKTTLKTLLTN